MSEKKEKIQLKSKLEIATQSQKADSDKIQLKLKSQKIPLKSKSTSEKIKIQPKSLTTLTSLLGKQSPNPYTIVLPHGDSSVDVFPTVPDEIKMDEKIFEKIWNMHPDKLGE